MITDARAERLVAGDFCGALRELMQRKAARLAQLAVAARPSEPAGHEEDGDDIDRMIEDRVRLVGGSARGRLHRAGGVRASPLGTGAFVSRRCVAPLCRGAHRVAARLSRLLRRSSLLCRMPAAAVGLRAGHLADHPAARDAGRAVTPTENT